jgi:hypothetical protein
MRVWIRFSASSGADAADAAVHHVRGGHHVGAGAGMAKRLFRQARPGSRRSSRSHADRPGRSNRPGRGWCKGSRATSVITPSSGNSFFRRATTVGTSPSGFQASSAPGVFLAPSTTGNRARAGTPSPKRRFGNRQQPVQTHALDPGHRGHGFGSIRAFEHEHGIDQIVGGKCVLTHQAPREIVTTHPTHSGSREMTPFVIIGLVLKIFS